MTEHEQMMSNWKSDKDFSTEYDNFKQRDEAKSIERRLALRKIGDTQIKIAKEMHTAQSAVSRIENFLIGKTENIPSGKSLANYAHALNGTLEISIKTPQGSFALEI